MVRRHHLLPVDHGSTIFSGRVHTQVKHGWQVTHVARVLVSWFVAGPTDGQWWVGVYGWAGSLRWSWKNAVWCFLRAASSFNCEALWKQHLVLQLPWKHLSTNEHPEFEFSVDDIDRTSWMDRNGIGCVACLVRFPASSCWGITLDLLSKMLQTNRSARTMSIQRFHQWRIIKGSLEV